ncbi:LuxR C-terminal-related transcriptional regulator [Sinomonas sp. ASV322]|uniref:helix-turn-helix transcriptional regulator n=1 Tax=Sinomonas sp. ASV322 TaxID=3041920 RepID=UPI0027DAB894|nr:LuxR C-terminal-related transcriptional regulator [Sinomonas sp. ASV322]MDQ4504325.1 LuxR C-terminal-related transcriptional regulator [Sinomonas sp. ASV322]
MRWTSGVSERRQTGARSFSADRVQWARNVRTDELRTAQDALRDSHSYGVVITGERDIGKGAFQTALVRSLAPDIYAQTLRSTMVGTETPYGALAPLLARLPDEDLESPSATMRGIMETLREDADGRPAVIALETPGGLDELSTATLVNLMMTGTAKVIVVANRTSDLPEDFHWMLTEQRIREIQLDLVPSEKTEDVLREALGGIVPRTVAQMLHAMAHGNPEILYRIVGDFLLSEQLRSTDGVWTLADDAESARSREIDDVVRTRVEREPPEVQTGIEALACARRLPLDRLTAVFGVSTVAAMDESGLIQVEDADRHSVSLADPVMADVVRGWLSIPRRRELRALVIGPEEPPLATLGVVELLGYAAWTRECQTVLPAAHAIAAAIAALKLNDPRFALDCLEGLPHVCALWATVQRLRANAHLSLGLPIQAHAFLEQVSEDELAALSPVDFAAFVESLAAVKRSTPGRSAEVPALIVESRTRLLVTSGLSDVDDDEVRHAMAMLELVEFTDAAARGDFAPILERLELAAAGAPGWDDELRLRAACLLMQAQVMLGREDEALATLHRVSSELGGPAGTARVRHEFADRAFDVLLYNGHWRQCLALVRSAGHTTVPSLRIEGAKYELAAGVALVYAGRGSEALSLLLAAIVQLEQGRGRPYLGCAYAAAAFAFAQQGDAAAARTYLDKVEGWVWPCSYSVAASMEFCADMARRWIGERGAAARLVEAAREDIRAGRWTMAGIKLVGATVDAGLDELALLEEVCEHRQGALAELGRRLARGTRLRSLPDLVAASDLSAGLELDTLESRCTAVALDIARDTGDVRSARILQARLDRLTGLVEVLPVVPQSLGPLLTAREREVAVLAARGESNRTIAEEMGLSVRTVEGHLYQVFSKLGITSRAELGGLL